MGFRPGAAPSCGGRREVHGPSPDTLDGWPGVADHALGRLSPEHLSVGWYALLLVAVAVAVIAGRHLVARLLGPSMAQIEDAAAAGVRRAINGSLVRIEAKIDKLEERVDERHAENLDHMAEIRGLMSALEIVQRGRRQN